MTTATATRTSRTPSQYTTSFGALLKSEYIKFTTIRSSPWTLSVAALLIVGTSVIIAITMGKTTPPDMELAAGAIIPTMLLGISQFALVVLGVIAIGSEYGTGMIRSSFVATPTRTPVILAKFVVMWMCSFVATTIAIFLAHFLVQPLLDSPEMRVTLSDPQVLRMIIGGGLYLATLSALALCIGAIVRNTAAGISTIVGLVLVLPVVLVTLPWEATKTMAKYLPGAGASVAGPAGTTSFSVWGGFAVLAAWAGVALFTAIFLAKKRDA